MRSLTYLYSISPILSEMYSPIIQSLSPIYIPKKHIKLKYADHKRQKRKRK